jgi:hypothetical protein
MRSPGSDTIDGYVDAAAGEMQGARYESGLDNSPMYDGECSQGWHCHFGGKGRQCRQDHCVNP